MEGLKSFVIMGLCGSGFGIGLTIIRNIQIKTLPFVFVAAFLCSGTFTRLNNATGFMLMPAFVSCFIPTMFLRRVYEKGYCPEFFKIVITSVYSICPGTTMGNLMHQILTINRPEILPLVKKLIFMTIGIFLGVKLAIKFTDKILKTNKI